MHSTVGRENWAASEGREEKPKDSNLNGQTSEFRGYNERKVLCAIRERAAGSLEGRARSGRRGGVGHRAARTTVLG